MPAHGPGRPATAFKPEIYKQRHAVVRGTPHVTDLAGSAVKGKGKEISPCHF
jgi:hypothetical protein